MMKLLTDVGSWAEGSRKAQAFAFGLGVVVLSPALAWPVVALTSAYILGRAVHDFAAEGKA